MRGGENVEVSAVSNPLYDVLTVKEVSAILKISLPLAYQLFKRKDFPALKIGQVKQKKVSRAAFEKWLMGESNKK